MSGKVINPCAFPISAVYDVSYERVNASSAYGCEAGMSLMDYFAARAPAMPEQWWLDTPKNHEDGSYVHIAEAIAAWNYFYAKVMLKERIKHEG